MLWQEGGVVGDVVDYRGIRIVMGSTEEKRGEKQLIHSKQVHNITTGRAKRVLTRYEVIPVKGGNIRENIPGVSRFRPDESEGKSCVFAMLGMRGG